MSLFVASLNSGSNGNCYYIGNDEEAVLVDAGLSRRETERRLKRLRLGREKIKGIFITHEHTDHTYGAVSLSKKHNIPVYITESTLQESRLALPEELVIKFQPYAPIPVGKLLITPVPGLHDAIDPHNFVVSDESVRVGVFTDVGFPGDHLRRNFESCHAAFLEANYDEALLETGSYPVALKNRIRGGKGHLSNKQARQLFLEHRPPYMTHLFLSHLSRNNNSVRIVKSIFDPLQGNGTEIVIATRYKETKLYHIRNLTGQPARAVNIPVPVQLQLFK